MDESQFLMLLRNNRELIIQKWLHDFRKISLDMYNEARLLQEVHLYFAFMLDLDTPIEQHEHVKGVPQYCKMLFENNIPSSHILHGSQLWRNSVMLFVEEKLNGRLIPMNVLRKIHQRMDQYERYIFDYYIESTKRLIADKESTITELHEARMTIIGKMAASMAHEIRNPLTSIMGFIKMMRKQISDRSFDKLIPYLDIIEVEFQNIQMHITGFLSFSKKEVIEESFVDVSPSAVIETVITLIHPRIIDENIELTFEGTQDVSLHIQKIAIQQVLSNILNNSIDALHQNGGVRKIIMSGKIEGEKYLLSISNNGPEIPAKIKESLFTPFVTGKKEGTGLGLTISKQIMNRNNGDISFISNQKETTFIMVFNLK